MSGSLIATVEALEGVVDLTTGVWDDEYGYYDGAGNTGGIDVTSRRCKEA